MSTENRTTIPLSHPVSFGDDSIDKLQLRKPQAGELRGIKLLDVMQMDVTAYIQLLPRITAPMLTEQQVSELDPADLMKVMNGVQRFFLEADYQTT